MILSNIIIFLLIKTTLCIEIILNIDYNSLSNYTNYKCGGVIIYEDLNIYPPCKNFFDAGQRAREINFENRDNITFYMKFGQLNSISLDKNDILGELLNFNYINIIAKNDENNKELIINAHIYSTIIDEYFIITSSSIFIENLKFLQFQSNNIIKFVNSTKSNIHFKNSWFTGGSLLINKLNNIIFENCTFEKITSSIYLNSNTTIIKNCIFLDNIYIDNEYDGLISSISNKIIISNCIFKNNINYNYIIYSNDLNLNIENSEFISNIFINFIESKSKFNQIINNCSFIDNSISGYLINNQYNNISSSNNSLIINNIIIDSPTMGSNYYIYLFDGLIKIDNIDYNLIFLNNIYIKYKIFNIIVSNNTIIDIINSFLPSERDPIQGFNNSITISNTIYNISLKEYYKNLNEPTLSPSNTNLTISTKTPTNNNNNYKNNNKTTTIITAIISSIIGMLIISSIIVVILNKKKIRHYIKKRNKNNNNNNNNNTLENDDQSAKIDCMTIDSDSGSNYLYKKEKPTYD